MNTKFKKLTLSIVCTLALLANIQCGSSAVTPSSTTSVSATEQALSADVVKRQIDSLVASASSLSLVIETRFTTVPVTCTNAGTGEITFDSTTGVYSLSYDDCDLTGGINLDGSLSITISGTSVTIEAVAYTYTSADGDSYSITGTISASLDTTTGIYTMTWDDYSASMSTGSTTTATFTGELVLDTGTSLLNGSLTMTFTGATTATVTCTYNDLDTSTATTDQYADACPFDL